MNIEQHSHVFPNGLVLAAETMPALKSAAFTILTPAGAAFERASSGGAASMCAEWVTRGAGGRDSRALIAALDNLGVSHGESAQTVHTNLWAATLGRNAFAALALFADILTKPALDDDEVEPIRALALQNLRGLDDDPGSKVIHELRKRHFPDPWGRNSAGTPEGIEQTTAEELRQFHADNYRPNGTILAVAGAVDWPRLRDEVERLLGDWAQRDEPEVEEHASGSPREHITRDTQQIQIALAFDAADVAGPDYYRARALAGVLGGYSSARLFTEVREKRGLCYSVYAGYESLRGRGAIYCHAGTSSDRAQETLDVTLAEIDRLGREGIARAELDMMRAGLKSSLIMQQESTSGRSASIASDWYYLGRMRTLEEISSKLDELTPESVGAYAAELGRGPRTIVTLGPRPLVIPGES